MECWWKSATFMQKSFFIIQIVCSCTKQDLFNWNIHMQKKLWLLFFYLFWYWYYYLPLKKMKNWGRQSGRKLLKMSLKSKCRFVDYVGDHKIWQRWSYDIFSRKEINYPEVYPLLCDLCKRRRYKWLKTLQKTVVIKKIFKRQFLSKNSLGCWRLSYFC